MMVLTLLLKLLLVMVISRVLRHFKHDLSRFVDLDELVKEAQEPVVRAVSRSKRWQLRPAV